MFKLPDLPFDAAALEPFMSRTTLETHHGKHHAAYIKKMNAALAERTHVPGSLEEVVRLAKQEGDAKLFNNAAQAWNHAFFWQCLTPAPQEAPQGGLQRAIEGAFDSIDAFLQEAKARGEGHFASGWLWLIADADAVVKLIDLHDAETPIVDAAITPLLTCDLWEHAYYLDYKNERGKFLECFFGQLINWRFAEGQHEAARSGGAKAWRFPT